MIGKWVSGSDADDHWVLQYWGHRYRNDFKNVWYASSMPRTLHDLIRYYASIRRTERLKHRFYNERTGEILFL